MRIQYAYFDRWRTAPLELGICGLIMVVSIAPMAPLTRGLIERINSIEPASVAQIVRYNVIENYAITGSFDVPGTTSELAGVRKGEGSEWYATHPERWTYQLAGSGIVARATPTNPARGATVVFHSLMSTSGPNFTLGWRCGERPAGAHWIEPVGDPSTSLADAALPKFCRRTGNVP